MTLMGRGMIMGKPPTTSWTPAAIDGAGLRWWYDGEGSVSGSDLLDLSSGNFDLTKTGTVNTGSVQLNGIDVLDFAGGRYTAATASDWKYLHDGTSVITVIAVAKFGTTSSPEAQYGLFGSNGGSSANVGVSMYFDDAGAKEDSLTTDISRGVGGQPRARRNENNDITPNAWHVIRVKFDAAHATPAQRIRIEVDSNGELGATSGTGAVSTSNPTYAFQLGAVGNSVVPLTGQIAEIFAYTDGSVADATAVAYAKTKYAL